MSIPLLIAFLGIIIGPMITYIVAARRLSGKITHSEASDLWQESRSIRQDLIKRNEFLRENIDRCQQKIELLEDRIDLLENTNAALHKENGELKQENLSLHKANEHLRKRVKQLELRVKELEDERI